MENKVTETLQTGIIKLLPPDNESSYAIIRTRVLKTSQSTGRDEFVSDLQPLRIYREGLLKILPAAEVERLLQSEHNTAPQNSLPTHETSPFHAADPPADAGCIQPCGHQLSPASLPEIPNKLSASHPYREREDSSAETQSQDVGFSQCEKSVPNSSMPQRDVNKEAVRQVNEITDSEPARGEELLESPELRRQLREAKERLKSAEPPSE